MIRWVAIIVWVGGCTAVAAWIIAEFIVQSKPKRWKALLKMLAGAFCLSMLWPDPATGGLPKAVFIFGLVACLAGCAEMVVAMLTKQDSSEPSRS
jgi:hypothetical protein